MKPEFQRILAPHAAVIFKSKLAFHSTANLLAKNVFAGIYFGQDEWNDEFGPFVSLLAPFVGFTVQLWPPGKEIDGHLLLRIEGNAGSIESDPEIDAAALLKDVAWGAPPDPEYEAAKRSFSVGM